MPSCFDRLLLILLASVLLLFGIGVWLIPTPPFSPAENRALRQFPEPSLSALVSGTLFSDFSLAFSDAFPLRRQAVTLKGLCELAMGKRENNGVFSGEGDTLIPLCREGSHEILEKNIRVLHTLSDRFSVPVTLAFPPRTAEVYRHLLPYPSLAEDGVGDRLRDEFPSALLPCSHLSTLAENGEAVWFRTDHHWTAEGAYVFYRMLAAEWGLLPYGKEDFALETVTHSFYGTAYSKSGCLPVSPDSLTLWRYPSDTEAILDLHGQGDLRQGLYCFDALEEKDAYRLFLGGNYGRLSVSLPSDGLRPRLLLIKDSYANALVPFLLRHFDLELIDPRYRTGDLPLEDFDRVLILLGTDTLFSDPSLSRLFQ